MAAAGLQGALGTGWQSDGETGPEPAEAETVDMGQIWICRKICS